MTNLLIATWNVNSIRARLPIILAWLKKKNPDILLLQELKARDNDIPKEEIEDLNYNIIAKGQKSYNGVAILSKFPVSDIKYTLPNFEEDEQARYIEGWVNIENKGLRVASIYAPNGNPIRSDKFTYKTTWLEKFFLHAKSLLEYEEKTILGGDFNICPSSIDAADENLILDDAIYQKEPRNIYRKIINSGYFDCYRSFHQSSPGFTYWDYGQAFNNNIGVRIDHFLMSSYAIDICNNVYVDKDPRSLPKPSDHTPLCANIDL